MANEKDGLNRLIHAYPEQLCGSEGNMLIWCDGSKMPYDDGVKNKDHYQKLVNADIQDQMELLYPRGTQYPIPIPKDFEPGRIRNEAFFKKMYGASALEVRSKLKPVNWLPSVGKKTLWVTSINGIDKKLQKISDELDGLPKEFKRYLDKPAGSFNWRIIAGEERLSPHSYGIAIDINTDFSDYWRWKSAKSYPPIYRNRIPSEIVDIFEKNGFIWGGKWYRFDTMHFEYRQELLN